MAKKNNSTKPATDHPAVPAIRTALPHVAILRGIARWSTGSGVLIRGANGSEAFQKFDLVPLPLIRLETGRLADPTLNADLEWLTTRGYCTTRSVEAFIISSLASFTLEDGRVATLESQALPRFYLDVRFALSGAAHPGRFIGSYLTAYSLTPDGFAVLDQEDKMTNGLAVPRSAKASGVSRRLRKPSDKAFQAYRLCIMAGMTQLEAAEAMQRELKVPVAQGQISRWLESVAEWVSRGNLMPDFPGAARAKASTHSIDPAKLDRGKRTDGRKRSRKSS